MSARLLAALLALLLAAMGGAARADGLVDNVSGLTIDADGKLRSFNGLVIGDDGRVKALLDRRDKRPERPRFRLDGKGRHLLPGMVDAHGHVMALGFALSTLDLSGTRSLAEAQARIADFAARNPDRPWITGRGWNQEEWGLGRFPTAAEIDAVVGDRPVWLERVDGHAGWANSRAMALAGIKPGMAAPAGGRIETAGGKPAGVFVDAAMALVRSALPPPRPVERDLALAKAQAALLAQGITAVADMGTSLEDWQAFRRAGDRGRLVVRIMAYADGIAAMDAIAGPEPTPWLYEDRLRMGGVKLYLDGALGSRGAWLKAPYSDSSGESGLPLVSESQLLNRMSRAAMDGFQLALHAIGDAANARALDAIEELSASYGGDRRWRIEHAQIVDPVDLPRFGRLGVIASVQPSHQPSDRIMAEARLGPERLAGAYAWASLAQAGAGMALGSDFPVEPPAPLAGIAAAISRTDGDGLPAGGWRPEERLGRETALAGFTADAARAGFAEGRFGRLLPGERADFILVDADLLLAPAAELRTARVLETWVGGVRVFEAANPSGR